MDNFDMMKPIQRYIAIIATMILCIVFSTMGIPKLTGTERFSAKKGQAWLGGNLSFHSISLEDNEEKKGMSLDNLTVAVAPILRFFPINYLSLGPKVSWEGVYGDGIRYNTWDIGIEPGIAYGGKNIISYLYISPLFNFESRKYILQGTSHTEDAGSFKALVTLGLIVPVAKSFGVQFESGFSYRYNKRNTEEQLFIGIGICGLGDKVAVSVINSLHHTLP